MKLLLILAFLMLFSAPAFPQCDYMIAGRVYEFINGNFDFENDDDKLKLKVTVVHNGVLVVDQWLNLNPTTGDYAWFANGQCGTLTVQPYLGVKAQGFWTPATFTREIPPVYSDAQNFVFWNQ